MKAAVRWTRQSDGLYSSSRRIKSGYRAARCKIYQGSMSNIVAPKSCFTSNNEPVAGSYNYLWIDTDAAFDDFLAIGGLATTIRRRSEKNIVDGGSLGTDANVNDDNVHEPSVRVQIHVPLTASLMGALCYWLPWQTKQKSRTPQ